MGHVGRPLLGLFPSSPKKNKQNTKQKPPSWPHACRRWQNGSRGGVFHVLPSALIKGPFKKQACLCAFHNQEEK